MRDGKGFSDRDERNPNLFGFYKAVSAGADVFRDSDGRETEG